MIKVKKHGVILEPTKRKFETRSVLNPGVLQSGNKVHIVYRAIDKEYLSTFGYAQLDGPTKVIDRFKQPIYEPKYKYEKKGVEDPRLTKIGNTIYMTYIAHDGKNACIAYAYGNDLFDLKRGGIISAQVRYSTAGKLFDYEGLKDDYYFFEAYYKNYAGKDVKVWEKDGMLFPQKFGSNFALMHRIYPDFQIIYFKNFKELKSNKFWMDYFKQMHKYVVLENKHGFEERHLGGGAPPIKTKDGWLMIYHGAEESNKRRVYHAGVALTDLKEPSKVLARLPYPLFSPEKDWELKGHVNNVVFPTGTAQFGDDLYIYYGAADSYIAAASVNLSELLAELKKHKVKK